MFGQVKIGTPEETCFKVAGLRPSLDQSGRFEVIETPVERAHRLQCASREQVTAGEDRCKRAFGIDGAREGGEDRASARRDLFDVSRSKRSSEDDPGQVGRVTPEGDDSSGIDGGFIHLAGRRVQLTLASNEALRDRHIQRSIFRQWIEFA
ncbi:hypothetical protein AWB68_08064 [Caballeronia choica]|uniref:Uncharacterized protein n=1 Tax=Caballeronia choica TaxID=326476 RepID=A0A158KZJ8_9BURK|nr:hypothetical protein AWB68_08064 [Caballeronia choica]